MNKIFTDSLDFIPDHHEGEADEETESAANLRHQGGPGIDQLLCLQVDVAIHGPQGEHQRTLQTMRRLSLVPNKLVLLVVTRLLASPAIFVMSGAKINTLYSSSNFLK